MDISIDNVTLPVQPKEFSVTIMDLDNGESTVRTADGTLTRDRIAVKRQLEITFPAMNSVDISVTLNTMSNEFFQVYYPDPFDGFSTYRTFYAGNRPVPVLMKRGRELLWGEFKVTLIEQ